jgi:hypothetical protein
LKMDGKVLPKDQILKIFTVAALALEEIHH